MYLSIYLSMPGKTEKLVYQSLADAGLPNEKNEEIQPGINIFNKQVEARIDINFKVPYYPPKDCISVHCISVANCDLDGITRYVTRKQNSVLSRVELGYFILAVQEFK